MLKNTFEDMLVTSIAIRKLHIIHRRINLPSDKTLRAKMHKLEGND